MCDSSRSSHYSKQRRELVISRQFNPGLVADEIDVTGIEHQLFASPKAICA